MNSLKEMALRKRMTGRAAYPVGRPFPRFPMLTEMTFGLHGVFALYGGTGIGKSTLAANLAADVMGEDYPCVYYDGENCFSNEGDDDSLTLARIEQTYNPLDARFASFFITPDYQTAIDKLVTLPRGFLVVDTVQSSIGATGTERDGGVRDALGARMAELGVLGRRYGVLLVSQLNNRSATGPQPLAAMKGASAIEQGVWAALAYGVDGDDRALVLQKLRRAPHPAWPKGSRITIHSDGQDRLTEAPAVRKPAAPKESIVEKVARVMAADPATSAAALGRAVGLGKTRAYQYQVRWRRSLDRSL
jgi:hypothetical protein